MTAADPSFASRHIGPSPRDRARMLELLGYGDLDAFTAAVVPEVIRWHEGLDLPAAASEPETLAELRAMADRNTVTTSMIGLGYYGTTPRASSRATSLETRLVHGVHALPARDLAGAARGTAELPDPRRGSHRASGRGLIPAGRADRGRRAMGLALRTSKGSDSILVDVDTHPQTIAVLQTRAEPLGVDVVIADLTQGLPDGDFAGVLISYPGTSGRVPDLGPLIEAAHARKALALVTTDLLSLTLLTPPGELGADVVVGSAQRLGVPFGFGGPHAGFMSVRAGLERGLPGRLVGVSVDADGAPAYRLALQTREQHIRREKATSNICTAQVLLAVISSMYAVYHGPDGLTAIAERAHRQARVLATGIRRAGSALTSADFFDTVRWSVPGGAERVVAAALAEGVNLRLVDADTVSASTDEVTTHDVEVAACAAEPGDGGSPPTRARCRPRRAAGGPSTSASRPVFASIEGRRCPLHPAAAIARRPDRTSCWLAHHEAQCHHGDGAHHPAEFAAPLVRTPTRRPIPRAHDRSRHGWSRSPATTPRHCSPTRPAGRAAGPLAIRLPRRPGHDRDACLIPSTPREQRPWQARPSARPRARQRRPDDLRSNRRDADDLRP